MFHPDVCKSKSKAGKKMTKYKSIAIKVALIGAAVLILSTSVGQQYADDLKPLIEMLLQQ